MMNKLDEVFKKILNDTDIFDSPYDQRDRKIIPKLFEGDKWQKLKKLFSEGNKVKFLEVIDARIEEIIKQEQNVKDWRLERINELKQRAEWLRRSFDEKPYLLKEVFETLSWYGLVKCKLPSSMDNYGKVIERYELSIVCQFFTDKISRANFPQNKALRKILEYVKELFNLGFSPEEIAYFVRKVDSLEKYWEVIE